MPPPLPGSRAAPVVAVKCVSCGYSSPVELTSVFEDFRRMTNDAIRIALLKKPKSRLNLIEQSYSRLKEYGLHTHYLLSACEVAYSVYRNKKRVSAPSVKKLFLKLDNQSYKLNHLILRIPTTPRHFVFITLRASEHHLGLIDDPGLKRGSVTINERSVSITFSKRTTPHKPEGFMGIDVNERNVAVSSTTGRSSQFKEIGEVVEIKEMYREIRAKISRTRGRDRRAAKKLLSKYGKRERDRTIQRVHKVTRQIVNEAKELKLGIKMEKLSGIRRLYRRGNGQGKVVQRKDEHLGLP